MMKSSTLVAALGLILTIALGGVLLKGEGSIRDAEMLGYADRIQTRIDAQISVLYSVRAFIESSQEVSRSELMGFIKFAEIETQAPGMQGVGIAIATALDDTTRVRGLLQTRYGLERDPWPETGQDVRFPIVFLEPNDERNRAALAYDMYSEETRRDAMNTAIRTDFPSATRKVTLVQEIDEDVQAGFLIYLPVFDDEVSIMPGSNIAGFVYAPFRARDLFEAALNSADLSNLNLVAFVGDDAPENLLFSNEPNFNSGMRHVINVANQDWLLVIGKRRPLAERIFRPSVLTFVFGTILSFLVAGFFHAQRLRAEANAQLALEQAARTEERELILGEMKHRLKNAIARIQSIASLSATDDPNVQAYVDSFTGRLHAMAKAQDLLAQSSWKTTSMRALIKNEISQVVDGSSEIVDSGSDDVLLDGPGAQAIGLIVHELATNAGKYGAFRQDGKLRITWSVDTSGEHPMVHLLWVESDLHTPPNLDRAGFGSNLISIMAEGQMGGQYSRAVEDGNLNIKISFPNKLD